MAANAPIWPEINVVFCSFLVRKTQAGGVKFYLNPSVSAQNFYRPLKIFIGPLGENLIG
jgi:hypothetical protein